MSLNPYYFIPVSDKDGPGKVALANWPDRAPRHLTHALFDTSENVYSGRLVCALQSVTPFVVGARQEKRDGQPTRVHPFLVDGEPALPASSLRGMISGVAEAVSNSALRVLGPDGDGRHLEFPHDKFAGVHPDLPPLGAGRGRQALTIAELMFGFVPVSDGEKSQNHSFAGRLRFSNARLAAGTTAHFDSDWINLKAMLSPDLDSVSNYFADSTAPGTKLRKADVRKTQVVPQGRKFYIHSEAAAATNTLGKNREMHMCVHPCRAGLQFFHHVDFFNLTRLELGLLCYAIRPSPKFQFKLGLAKPNGFGSFAPGRFGLFVVYRATRYRREELDAPRYNRAWWAAGLADELWPDRYVHEATARAALSMDDRLQIGKLADEFREVIRIIDPKLPEAVEQIGDPANASGQTVRYLIPSNAGAGLSPLSGRATDRLPAF